MSLKQISLKEFSIELVDLFSRRWLLLTAGDFAKKQFNAMTIGWGSFGVMWLGYHRIYFGEILKIRS